jgi:hypothetical protein
MTLAVRHPMQRKRATTLSLAGLILAATLAGCTVDFDVAQPNAFRCDRDSDCIAPSICVKAEDAQDDDPGVCGPRRDPNVNNECADEDGDGYGEGPACKGPDCDDDDADVNPEALEICDGKDNDCDCAADARDACPAEMIDEVTNCAADEDCDMLADADNKASQGMRCVEATCQYRCPLDTVGVCGSSGPDGGGAVERCAGGQVPGCGVSGAYGPNYSLVEESREPCDGLDNNCNNTVDGNPNCNRCDTPCSRDVGECTAGLIRCENGEPIGCFIEGTDERAVQPVDEVCDDKDNDCNGVVDNSLVEGQVAASVCEDKCPAGMILLRPDGPNNRPFCIDRFEASRPDATATSPGEDTRRAVSRPGVLPWTGLSLAQARDACQAAGLIDGLDYPQKRLCELRELTFACGGVNNDRYSYGLNYNANICNGADAGVGAVVPTGPTGEVPRDFGSCTATRGEAVLYDLIGNAAEFVLDNNQGKIYGGSFATDANGLTCQSAVDGQDAAPQIGFRCCFTP